MNRTTSMARFAEEGTSVYDTPQRVDATERDEIKPTHPVSLLTPLLEQLAEIQPLPAVIGAFNITFERHFDTAANYSRTTLENMAWLAGDRNYPWLQKQLTEHAKRASQIV